MHRQQGKLAVALLFSLSACSSNDPATNQIVQQGTVSSLGVNAGTTMIVEGPDECSGAAGSVAPPLVMHGCIGELNPGSAPPTLGTVFLRSVGVQSTGPVYHVALQGVERFWVRQDSENTCWAAALETARAYVGLQRQPQRKIYEMVANACPVLRNQQAGANMYQIVFAIRRLGRQYDNKTNIASHFCDDVRCIIAALQRNRPVIALNSGHAVIIAGMDYSMPSEGIQVIKFQVLDPAGNGSVEERPRSAFCGGDAFIAL